MIPNRPVQQAIALTLAALTLSASAIFASQLAAQSTEPSKDNAATASADGGEEAFNNACRTCHSVKPGDNRLGPSLAGIVGKKAGGEAGYAYSPSLKGSGVTFDAKTLDAFIANPDSVVAGNNMKPYTGISDAAVRAKIVTFLGGK